MPVPRICIVGCGNWSTRLHLPAILGLVKAGLVSCAGVCDLNRDAAADYAAALGTGAVYTEAAAMLDRCRPDGLAIVVDCEASPRLAMLSIEKRVPFLIEKPPAPDTPTHADLLSAVAGLPHVVAYNRRHSPYVSRAAQWMAGHVPQVVTALMTRHGRREPDFSTTAVHAVDTALFLAGGRLASARIEAVKVSGVFNFFISAVNDIGTRIAITITPDTASAQEHYAVRSLDRSAVVLFPHPGVIDYPGRLDLHEKNSIAARLEPGDFGIRHDDEPALAGISGEYRLFLDILSGAAEPVSTLLTSLDTQLIRASIMNLAGKNGGVQEISP
ncbi:MAG: Gfo/Idh/MocA family oxidoreductase [Planctomycetes bacterium]|nr:Gfo/Idh/MocA family oxidoreductase [Planctomycetota bacterium]